MTSGGLITSASDLALPEKLGELGLATGDVLCGKYRIAGELGRGGMGVILAATHLELGEPVALKILSHTAINARSLLRLRREARIAARLRSEHVVQVRDIDEFQPGMPMMVMERLEGEDLAAILQQRGVLQVEELIDWVIQACDALAEAHAQGIVHRDLKPSNLFIARRFDGSSVLKVLDFGVSKFHDSSLDLTATASLLGSPPYMSPEQVLNAKTVDHRTDIWSLGIVFFEALTGHKPFVGASQAELMERISKAPVPPIGRADVSADLEAIVRACLEKDVNRRISSAMDLAWRLEPFAPNHAKPLLARIRRVGSSLQSEPEQPVIASSADETAAEHDNPSTHTQSTLSEEMDDVTQDPLVGTLIANTYTIERKLGEGAMGVVYSALGIDGTRHAVKVLRAGSGNLARARIRFQREARAASGLRNEHIVRIQEVIMDHDRDPPTIVMELLQGRDLARVIRDIGAIEPEGVVRIFAQVCDGLAAAHEAGLVHRDVKPANIFLHENGNEIQVKVCDFGIAKINLEEEGAAPSLTASGFVLGTPLYMAPEQAKNAKHVDERADIWAVCISMYEALSGRTPWSHHTTPSEVVIALCTEDAALLSKSAPWVDRRLVEVIHKGLRRNPAERWASATELREALLDIAQRQSRLSRDHLVPASRKNVSPISVKPHSRLVMAMGILLAVVISAGGILAASIRKNTPTLATLHIAPLIPTSVLSAITPRMKNPPPEKPTVMNEPKVPMPSISAEQALPGAKISSAVNKTNGRKPPVPVVSGTASSAQPPPERRLELQREWRGHK